jgi:hypothetical protein
MDEFLVKHIQRSHHRLLTVNLQHKSESHLALQIHKNIFLVPFVTALKGIYETECEQRYILWTSIIDCVASQAMMENVANLILHENLLPWHYHLMTWEDTFLIKFHHLFSIYPFWD